MNNIIEKFIDSKDIKLSSKNVYIRNLKKLYSILNLNATTIFWPVKLSY